VDDGHATWARRKEARLGAPRARYPVRAGACVMHMMHKSKDLATVLAERFGDATGYVGSRVLAD